MQYKIFSWNIESEWELPGLSVADDFNYPDIIIRSGKVDQELPQALLSHGGFEAMPGKVLLKVPGVLRISVNQGNEIIVDLEPRADLSDIQAFVLGPAIGALLQQRGLMVLHASAVRVGENAVMFAGPSAAGKSTLAAAFAQRGYPVLADEHSVLEFSESSSADIHCQFTPTLVPFIPRMLLWENAINVLGLYADDLQPERLGLKKYHFPVENRLSEPLSVSNLILISNAPHGSDISIQRKTGLSAIQGYRQALYRKPYLRGMNLLEQSFSACAHAARHTSVASLERPRSLKDIPKLVDTLIEYVTNHG